MMDIIQRATVPTREKLVQEEKELLEKYAGTNKVAEKGLASVFEYIYARVIAERIKTTPEVLILNAATASAIRRRIGDLPGIRMVISPAVETGLAYHVTDENLKKQLLNGIVERW